MFERTLSTVPCTSRRGCTPHAGGRRRRAARPAPTARLVTPATCEQASATAPSADASALVAAFVIGVASAVLAVMLMVNVATRMNVASLF